MSLIILYSDRPIESQRMMILNGVIYDRKIIAAVGNLSEANI